MHWLSPINTLKGIGPDTTTVLQRIGIRTLRDALLHFPSRYEDRSRITPIAHVGTSAAVVQGVVRGHHFTPGQRSMLTVTIQDDSGYLRVIFFNSHDAVKAHAAVGAVVRFYGKVKPGRNGLEMTGADYVRIVEGEVCSWDLGMKPVYPLCSGLSNARLTRVIKLATSLLDDIELPQCMDGTSAFSLRDALRFVHNPSVGTPIEDLESRSHPALQRLVMDELISQQVSMRTTRNAIRTQHSPILTKKPAQLDEFIKKLPFQLTSAQQRVNAEIAADLASDRPMLRLLQGDVGSGKTLVAAIASLIAISHGYQVVMMAPTELLATQHEATFREWFEPLGITVTGMGARRAGKAKTALLDTIVSGEAKMIIGTHALFQQDVVFHQIGLVIIDEQHRFGVQQRLELLSKGACSTTQRLPHQLVMTATPIPRTLQMTAFADLDVSVIDELPPGRTPIKTVVMNELKRIEITQRVLKTIEEKKQQVYWVCPLIEESENKQAQAAESLFMELHRMLPGVTIGLVHGRLPSKQKNAVMSKFAAAEIQVLVATTVVEVGVNVPNASLMIIENAERLGLAQLHQLRGRVGRGAAESFCILLYKAPVTAIQKDRLGIMRETTDGFLIAQKDLENRGAGDVLGSQQTGMVKYHIADLALDEQLIPIAQSHCDRLLTKDPQSAITLCQFWFGDEKEYALV